MDTELLDKKKQKLEQQKARLLRKAQKLKTEERKKQAQHFIHLGQLAADFGLDALDTTTLVGAFLDLKERLKDTDASKKWTESGLSYLQKKEAEQVPIIVTFPSPPSKEIQGRLKEQGLKWNPFRKEWQGYVDISELKKVTNGSAANIQQLNLPAETASDRTP